MKIAIRYYSKTGNTKKLADAISEATHVPAETVDVPLDDNVDILFLGSAVYGAGVDEKIKSFISSLDASKINKVVNFSTAALLPSTYSQISKMLATKNIPIDSKEYHCRGKFRFMHKDRPNQKDLNDVKTFVNDLLQAADCK